MKFYISTNVLKPHDLERIFDFISPKDGIGIELFPFWECQGFEEALEKSIPRLCQYDITMHGPYFHTEHSYKKGSDGYKKSMDLFIKSLELCKKVNCSSMVFHHNNINISSFDKAELIENSSENLKELNSLSKAYDVELLVENAGVIANGNMLFDEDEFINMAISIENNVLLDIGHSHANGWSLEKTILSLQDKITAYHIHNNDGRRDLHNRIFDGNLDVNSFANLYRKYTPKADIIVEMGNQCDLQIGEIIDDIRLLKRTLKI